MNQITFSIVQNEDEIEILRNRSGKYNDFTYTYEETRKTGTRIRSGLYRFFPSMIEHKTKKDLRRCGL